MCEFSQGLVAWLDGELPEGDAAKIERHLVECGQCRGRLSAFRQASDAFEEYCKTYADTGAPAKAAKHRRISIRPARTIYGAAAIAAGIAVFFLATAPLHSPRSAPAEIASAAAASQPVEVAQKGPASQPGAVASPRATPNPEESGSAQIEGSRSQEDTNALGGEAAVEIAIPADDIFPPGAVPAGVSFTADVTMGSDGSAEQIRLRPQFTEFERKGAQR